MYCLYINCNNWERDFQEMNNVLLQNSDEGFLVIGDKNVRIGKEQKMSSYVGRTVYSGLSSGRNSKDTIVNSRGRRYLDMCTELGFIILNGRMEGDLEGEMTFVGAMGNSVNDIAAINLDYLNYVADFKVVPQAFSDHLPIEVVLNVGKKTVDKYQCLPLLPKLAWNKVIGEKYKDKIASRVNNVVLSDDVDQASQTLTECIREVGLALGNGQSSISFERKQAWFDNECWKARSKVLSLLNLYHRIDNDCTRKLYLYERNKFKKICYEKRKSYEKTLINSISAAQNSRDFWQALNKFKLRNNIVNNAITPQDWVNYFQHILNPEMLALPHFYAEPYIVDNRLDRDFSREELSRVLKLVKNNKAPGEDQIPFEYYKNAPDNFLNKLLNVYNSIFTSGRVPHSFKSSIIFPLFKKGECDVVANFRGISFLSTFFKIFAGLILNRLNCWVEEDKILNEFQAGFRKGYSTIDNIFALTSIISLRLAEKKG